MDDNRDWRSPPRQVSSGRRQRLCLVCKVKSMDHHSFLRRIRFPFVPTSGHLFFFPLCCAKIQIQCWSSEGSFFLLRTSLEFGWAAIPLCLRKTTAPEIYGRFWLAGGGDSKSIIFSARHNCSLVFLTAKRDPEVPRSTNCWEFVLLPALRIESRGRLCGGWRIKPSPASAKLLFVDEEEGFLL